jgi:tetratricopeptide (TPR) repeat protein
VDKNNPGAPALRSDEASAICLADPGGKTPLDEEIRKVQQPVRDPPEKVEEWIGLGGLWVRKARISADPGFYVNVEACVNAALGVEPGHPAALGLRGLALMNGHKFTEARTVAEEILRKEPKDPVALGIQSDASLELGQFDEAAKAAKLLMDLRPGMASYSRVSYLRWLQGDTANAKILIREALKAGRNPRDPEPTAWTFVQAATIFWHEADYEGADAVFAEALKWVPDYLAALVGRARVALSQGQPQRAIEFLEQAYRRSPLPETAWLLGDARAMLNDQAGAEVAYQQVIKEGRRIDRLTLALFYAVKNRDLDEALRLIETERGVRNNIYVNDAHAWILYRLGRLAEAKAQSDRALQLGTREARLLYHAGAIRLAAGEPEGRALIEQALALNPEFDGTEASEARKLLDEHVTSAP